MTVKVVMKLMKQKIYQLLNAGMATAGMATGRLAKKSVNCEHQMQSLERKMLKMLLRMMLLLQMMTMTTTTTSY